jgi:threonine dehydratase
MMKVLVKDIVVAGGVREIPLDESGVCSEKTVSNFLLKGEHLQRTGAFKLRGALNRVRSLNDEDRENGIIAASSGNHGIATAYAAKADGGGLIGGTGSYLKAKMPEVDIIGCWAENAFAMHQGLEKGEIFDAPESDTLSDGAAGGIEEGAITFPICQQVIDRHILVTEDEITSAMCDTAANKRFIIEGSERVAIAAALKTASDYTERNIAVVICGRNIALDTFRAVLGGSL